MKTNALLKRKAHILENNVENVRYLCRLGLFHPLTCGASWQSLFHTDQTYSSAPIFQ